MALPVVQPNRLAENRTWDFDAINGTLRASTPLADLDVTNKLYVDTGLALKLNSGDFGTQFALSLAAIDTDDVAEGSNLYFTNARARGALSGTAPITFNAVTGAIGFDGTTLDHNTLNNLATGDVHTQYYNLTRLNTWLAGKTTDNLTEGAANLYWSNTLWDARFAVKTTTDLTEGVSLYFTTARARTSISGVGAISYDNTTGVISVTPGVGLGDVIGPVGAISNNFATYDGVTGKIIKDSGLSSASFLKIDQTTPQTIINGVPLMTTAVNEYGSSNQLVNKAYVDGGTYLMPPIIDWYDPTGGLPVAPSVGDRYGSDATANGWTIDYIYEWDGSVWVESEPEEGWMLWDLFGLIFWVFFSGGWMEEGEDSYLKLDQSTPQTVQGRPVLDDGLQLGLTPTIGATDIGKMYWDVDWKTPICELEDDVRLQIGQETMAYIYNGTGGDLTQGDVVYTSSTQAGVPSVSKALGDVAATSAVLGVITSTTIANGDYGYATIRGHVNNIDTSTWALNDELYLSADTAGMLTNVKPNTGDYDTRVGRVMLVDASTGRVYVNIVREYAVGQVSAGAGVDFFLDDATIYATSANNTYLVKTLLKTPNTTAEDVDSIAVTAATSPVLYGEYLWNLGLGDVTIQGGVWEFDIYAGVSSATNTSSLTQNIYRSRPEAGTITIDNVVGTTARATASTGTPFDVAKIDASAVLTDCSYLMITNNTTGLYPIIARTSDTVVTITVPAGYTPAAASTYQVQKKLFGITTGEINNVATAPLYAGLQLYSITTVQPAFTILATDELGTKMFGVSTGTRTLYFAHNGTTRYSHFTSPLILSHNDLSGLQGGAASEYYHLTSARNTFVGAITSTAAQLNYLASATGTTGTATTNVVFSASPTFTGVPVLAAPTATTLLIGADANFTDFPNTKLVVSQANTGVTNDAKFGIVGEAVGTTGVLGVAVGGYANAGGSGWGIGVFGGASVTATGDTGGAYGGYFNSIATHAGGNNTAVYAEASNGATNYSFYGAAGILYNAVNVGIGTATFGANATQTLAIYNGTAPSDHVDNEIQIYSADTGDSTATLALMLEQQVEAIGTFTASHKIKVIINGAAYWLQLDEV